MFKNISIKYKLTLLAAACTVVALVVASGGFLYYDLISYKAKMKSDLTTQAEIIGTNCSAGLTFKDNAAVQEVLRSLRAMKEVEAAGVYTPDRKLFADYTRKGVVRATLPASGSANGAAFVGDTLQVYRRIRSDNDTVGILFVQSDMSGWYVRRDAFVQLIGCLLALSVGLAILLASRLQRLISRPILDLSRTMRSVAATEDYSVRATKNAKDEVGELVDGFNTMLSEIEERDHALQEANSDLEERVKERTVELEREIAERKAAEEDLVKSERSLSDFFENATVGLHWADADGNILRANRSELEMLGYSSEEYLGRPIIDFHEDKEAMRDVIARLADGEPAISYETAMRCKDGTTKHVGIDTSVLWEDGRFIHTRTFTRDLTAQNEAENAERARDQAERANIAKSEFLSRMSHELRTPMNSILGFSQLLQLEGLQPNQEDSVKHILNAGKHLLNLINEVLDISRIEAGRLDVSLEPVDLAEVLGQVCSLIEPLAGQRRVAVMSPRIEEQDLFVHADRQRLYQVLLNVISNAIKYNIEFGEVQIGIQHVDDWVRLTVTDTGPGISPDKMTKIFTPFERMGAEQTTVEGTGLGLALSKRLTEAMGGRIGLLPAERGACFYVDFPLAECPTRSLNVGPAIVETSMPATAVTQVTVLLVEDNLANVRLIEKIFETRPQYKLLVAMQGTIALALAQEHRPDLVLLDLNLPDIDGLEVLNRLVRQPETADTKVAVISADATAGRVERLLAAGAFAYITKPLDLKQFLDLLERCSQDKRDKAA